MDREAFKAAIESAVGDRRVKSGIGTVGEKTLHAVLKNYFEPDTSFHEINVGPFVADIYNFSGFTEIQTSSFYRLKDRLEMFLSQAPVTVVYPVPALKWVIWVEEDGTVSKRHKSSKNYGPWEILPELYGLHSLLGREGLRFCVVMLELEEYRLKNGWGSDGKRGSTRFERMPIDILDEIWIEKPDDYLKLIPNSLPQSFTSKEFSKAARLKPLKTNLALKVLTEMNALNKSAGQGRAYIYSRASKSLFI